MEPICLGVKSYFVLTCGLLGVLTIASRAQTLEADYQVQNTLSSSVGTIGALTPVGFSAGLTFVPAIVDGNSQLVLNVAGDPNSGETSGVQAQTAGFGIPANNYSVVLLANFDLTTPTTALTTGAIVTKVLDFKNLSSDAGLYINDATGLLEFIDGSAVVQSVPALTISPINSGAYTQLVLTRDGTSGVTSVYENGALALSFVDGSNLAVLGDATNTGNAFLTFFKDDGQGLGGSVNDESSEGNIARIRLYDAPLSATQVANLSTTVAPEPSTYLLLAVGGAAFLLRRKVRGLMG